MMKKRRYLRLGWLLPLATRTARIMAGTPTRWRGTLILIGQPAEESGGGAKAMLADGLFTRFPRPDYALAVHDDARESAGILAITPRRAVPPDRGTIKATAAAEVIALRALMPANTPQ